MKLEKQIKVDAIITARGGSKRLPGKNIKLLDGKPLISYTINAARKCSLIDRCYVSTEDNNIKKTSVEWGAEIIDRPSKLAADDSLSKDVVRDALEFLSSRNECPDYFVLLQPTSPLRNEYHIEDCINKFFQSQANSVVSVTQADQHPYKQFLLKEDNKELLPFLGFNFLDYPNQKLPLIYRPNGAIYCISSSLFLNNNSFFVSPIIPYIMSQEDSVDIDTEIDFELASIILQKRFK